MFRFALEPLLDLRRRAEDAARARFERRRRAYAAACAEVAALEGELRRYASGAGGSGALLGAVATSLDARERAAADALAALDEARPMLIAASRERRVVEALRQRRQAAYEAERRRREQRELDEANARVGTHRRYGPRTWLQTSSPITWSR